MELAWAELLGVVLLLAPVPARLKEWAYAGFAITLGSALIAHFAVGDGPEAWGFAAGTGVLWGLSYFFWLRLEGMPASEMNPAGILVVKGRVDEHSTETGGSCPFEKPLSESAYPLC